MPDKVTQEIVLCFWKGDKLEAISRKNGHLELYRTEQANYGDAAELFGAHTPDKIYGKGGEN